MRLGTDSNYEWTPKRKLYYHRSKRFAGWRRGRNAGKTWADFQRWEKEHPDGVTLESIILRETEAQEMARARQLEEQESCRIARLREELIRLIRRKDWTHEEKKKAIGVINMMSNAKIKEMHFLE
jgi:hypothetical protein